MSPIKTCAIDFEEGRMYHEVAGEGEPLVFLHAVFDSRMWDDQWEQLPQHYSAIRFDARGFGRSDPPKGPVSRRQEFYRLLEGRHKPCHPGGLLDGRGNSTRCRPGASRNRFSHGGRDLVSERQIRIGVGCAHLPNIEKPVESNRAVGHFLHSTGRNEMKVRGSGQNSTIQPGP